MSFSTFIKRRVQQERVTSLAEDASRLWNIFQVAWAF